MRVFVTGSTGFVGTAVVKELLSAGHTVLGLTRSDKGIEQLKSQGAEPLRGTLDDLELLGKAASGCDAAIHLAFEHGPTNFVQSCAKDRAAIAALGDALVATSGTNKALVVTSGTMLLGNGGDLRTEDDPINFSNAMAQARGPSEQVCLDYAKKGLRAAVVRLPPITHGPGSSGFAGHFAVIALTKGKSAYVGDGQNRLCAGHRDDAALLYRLAAEKAEPGSVFHAVSEDGVVVKDIATAIGKQLHLPVVSVQGETATEHFGWFCGPSAVDNFVSSKKTQERLGWEPTHVTLLEDIPAIVDFARTRKAH